MTREEIFAGFEVRKLGMDERVESFDCGDADLNDFILNESPLYRKALLAVSYVLEHKETHKVAAIPFYEKNRFVPLNSDDKDSHTRLFFFDLETSADVNR